MLILLYLLLGMCVGGGGLPVSAILLTVTLAWLEHARRVLCPESASAAVVLRTPSRLHKLIAFAQKSGT